MEWYFYWYIGGFTCDQLFRSIFILQDITNMAGFGAAIPENELYCRKKGWEQRMENVVGEIVTTAPKWFTDFLGFDDLTVGPPKGWEDWLDNHNFHCGGFKIVYTKKEKLQRNNKPQPCFDVAISIEALSKSNTNQTEIINKIKKVVKKEPRTGKHLIYPKEQFTTRSYVVSLMSNCPGGELYDMVYSNRVNVDMLRDLAQTLDTLHENNIAIGDLKMENIMLCACKNNDKKSECLSFIDLDAAISLTNSRKKNTGKRWGRYGIVPKRICRTPWFQPISIMNTRNLNQDDLYISDWTALALILTYFIGIRLESDMQNEAKDMLRKKFEKSPKLLVKALNNLEKNPQDEFWFRRWLRSNSYPRKGDRKYSRFGDVLYLKISDAFNDKDIKKSHPFPKEISYKNKTWFGDYASVKLYENAFDLISNIFKGVDIYSPMFDRPVAIKKIEELLTSLNIGYNGEPILPRMGEGWDKVKKALEIRKAQQTGKKNKTGKRRFRKTYMGEIKRSTICKNFKEELKF